MAGYGGWDAVSVVRLTQIDGKLPNLALMKIAHFHRQRGDAVAFSKDIYRGMDEPEYTAVYGSAVFTFSADRVATFKQQFPNAIVGGTFDQSAEGNARTVESVLGIPESEVADWSIYPRFSGSLGFTQRGCRFKCGFCNVPKKEGKPRAVNTIGSIWRGAAYPKHIHLLDNDFFGQPRAEWQARIDEIKGGKFKVCWNQGINIRMITDESAAALKAAKYWDDGFKTARLYTAWDNIGHEDKFFTGIDILERNGIPPSHVMAYMLVGWDKNETWERVLYRLNRMKERGIKPYPMIYGDRTRQLPLGGCNQRIGHRRLMDFQRWVIKRFYIEIPFGEYERNARGGRKETQMSFIA